MHAAPAAEPLKLNQIFQKIRGNCLYRADIISFDCYIGSIYSARLDR